MPITQKELASRLGLSRQIVGHALSGYPRVAEETRRRVLDAAAEAGYSVQSNQAARSLIAQRYGGQVKKNAVSVLTPMTDGSPIRKLPYFIPLLDGVELEAIDLGVDLLLHSMRIGHMPRFIGDFLVDGVIGFCTTPERNEWMFQHGLPQVLIDANYDNNSVIRADHAKGIGLCTQHLIDLGHRSIAYFAQSSSSTWRTGAERYEAFVDTMKSNGLSVDPRLSWSECERMRREDARLTMAAILDRQNEFTAVVCYNDLLAFGVIDALTDAGLSVPNDVSVTGFDDLSSDYGFSPAVTSVRSNREETGREALRMLYRMIDFQIDNPTEPLITLETVMPVELIVHHSTGPAKHISRRI